ncbi:MAG: hypothetical protein VKL39_08395 [Leptolyngbyaceae bacterium]|nr:hypothetical protein [Leptolyngbyaceae bacterium]
MKGTSEKGRSRIVSTICMSNGIKIGWPDHAINFGIAKATGSVRSHPKVSFR